MSPSGGSAAAGGAAAIVAFAPEHLPAVVQFSERVWTRPRTVEYYRWRYLDPPLQRAWLVLRDGECLAMLVAFDRPYRFGAERLDVLEVYDWFALPQFQRAGLGVRLIRHLMQQGRAMLMVGGTRDAHALMPRLGFATPAHASHWLLPLTADAAAGAVARRVKLPPALLRAGWAAGPAAWFRPRRRRAPANGRVVPVARPGPELAALYERAGSGTVPLWPETHLSWLLAGFAGGGHYVPLYFSIADELRGWALIRVVETDAGCEAALVTVWAPTPDASLYAWMVAEATACAAGFAPRWIQTETTCPLVAAALQRNHYLRRGDAPVWWWPGEKSPPTPLTLGFDTGDVMLLPYRERWWGAAVEESKS